MFISFFFLSEVSVLKYSLLTQLHITDKWLIIKFDNILSKSISLVNCFKCYKWIFKITFKNIIVFFMINFK